VLEHHNTSIGNSVMTWKLYSCTESRRETGTMSWWWNWNITSKKDTLLSYYSHVYILYMGAM